MALATLIVTVFLALLAASVTLYTKRLDRLNATEARHSKERESAYDKLLAAGDAGWYYRTYRVVHRDEEETDWDTVCGPIIEVFNSGVDQLKQHSTKYDDIEPVLAEWDLYALHHPQSGPREFDNARDKIVNLRRQESGLRKNIRGVRDLSFYDRFMTGHVLQRLPEGIDNVLRTTDGEFMIQGSGEEFVEIFQDMFIKRPRELRVSRETARQRLAEWREKEVWKLPATDREVPEQID